MNETMSNMETAVDFLNSLLKIDRAAIQTIFVNAII
jgi:hypothetical protein